MSGPTNVQYQSGLYGGNNNSSSPVSSREETSSCERLWEVCRGEVVRQENTPMFTASPAKHLQESVPDWRQGDLLWEEVCVCQQCSHSLSSDKPIKVHGPSYCAGCGEEIKQGQSLLALERQWHVSCFKCRTCGCALTGEYISKDGIL
ncbi:actin-binding LIM protein 3-like isoform X1 [Lates japonicus]|uniref:Actin-binding LIM protein 3-like isoform X1 n=1 Tax=Lates japonicus TaxID=270547 RepID=A0AAD3N9Z4_LATJO|nr:actin-binding LIM protein 3-like isoform X1 [Lates japonicus]